MSISSEDSPTLDEALALYGAVGWTAYTKDAATLRAALAGTSCIVTARDDERLVGLARAISDDATVCYLQDILVSPEARRRGTGRALVQAVLQRYGHVRQVVLMTDAEAGQRAFYESLGFTEIRDLGAESLRSFVRLAPP